MKDYGLMKKWLAGNLKKGEPKKKPEAEAEGNGDKEEAIPNHDVLMIFGGPAAYESQCKQKVTRREVFAAEPTTPAFLRWSESAITFDCADHPSSIPQPEKCP